VNQKPSIVEVVGDYVQLRRAGKELIGLCPFHSEKTPSFAVNEDKGVFYCHACQEGGDVVTFIRKLKGLGYREAIAEIGMDPGTRRPAPDRRLLAEARKVAQWANEMTRRAEYLLRDIGQRSIRAKECGFVEEIEALVRDWAILEMIADDLQSESRVLELYEQRKDIEHLLANAHVEPLPESPALLLEMFSDRRVPVL
jgi:DNA primase